MNFNTFVGIDLMDAMGLFQQLSETEDVARKCKILEQKIKLYQDSFTAIDKVNNNFFNIKLFL